MARRRLSHREENMAPACPCRRHATDRKDMPPRWSACAPQHQPLLPAVASRTLNLPGVPYQVKSGGGVHRRHGVKMGIQQ